MRHVGPKAGKFFHLHFSLLTLSVYIIFIPCHKEKQKGRVNFLCSWHNSLYFLSLGTALLLPFSLVLQSCFISSCSVSCALPLWLYCLHTFPNTAFVNLCHTSATATLLTSMYLCSAVSQNIIGCGRFHCFKTCKLPSVAGWAVLEHLCLLPRQASTNFIPCVCFQVLWTCALATTQGSLRRPTFCLTNTACLMIMRAVFLPTTWHLPNESFLPAKADFISNLRKDFVSLDSHPSLFPGVKMNFNSFVSWE